MWIFYVAFGSFSYRSKVIVKGVSNIIGIYCSITEHWKLPFWERSEIWFGRCRHLYVSYWFSWDILSLTKGLSESFRLLSSWDLLLRFLRLYIIVFLLWHLNLIMVLSDLFIWWQARKSLGTTSTLVSVNFLQMFSFKTSPVMSAGTGFNSIASILLYYELVTVLRSNCMILVNKCGLNFLNYC